MLRILSTVRSYFALLALMIAPFYASSQTSSGFYFSVMTKEGKIVKRDSSYGYKINAMVGDRICILNNEQTFTSASHEERFYVSAVDVEQKGWIHISKGKEDMWIHYPWIDEHEVIGGDTIPFIPGSFSIDGDSIERFISTTEDYREKLRRLRFKLEEYPENKSSEILPRFWEKEGEVKAFHTPTVFINDSVRDNHPYFKKVNYGAVNFCGPTEVLITPMGPDGDPLSLEANDCSFSCYIYRSCFVREGKEEGTYYLWDGTVYEAGSSYLVDEGEASVGKRRRDTFPMVVEGEPMIYSKTTQEGYVIDLPHLYHRTTGELHIKTECGGQVMEVFVPYWDSTFYDPNSFYDLDFSRDLLLDSIPFKPGKWKLNLQQLYPCEPEQRERGYCDISPDEWEDSEAVQKMERE